MLGVLGGVKEIDTKVKHGRHKLQRVGIEGGNRGWDVFHWLQGMERGVSIMEVDGPLVVHRGKGEYAT